MAATHDDPTVVIRADHVPGLPQGDWTYADYAALPDDGHRYEVIGGVLYQLPPPNERHQSTVARLARYLELDVVFMQRGTALVGPTVVELPPRGDVTRPDIRVVLNEQQGRVTPSHVVGAPDLIVEVTAPSTATHDYSVKLEASAHAGTPEYWIADSYARTIEVFVLRDGGYRTLGYFAGNEKLPSLLVPNLAVTIDVLFPRPERHRRRKRGRPKPALSYAVHR